MENDIVFSLFQRYGASMSWLGDEGMGALLRLLMDELGGVNPSLKYERPDVAAVFFIFIEEIYRAKNKEGE